MTAPPRCSPDPSKRRRKLGQRRGRISRAAGAVRPRCARAARRRAQPSRYPPQAVQARALWPAGRPRRHAGCEALSRTAQRAHSSRAARRTPSCRSTQGPALRSACSFLIAGHTEDWPVAKGGSSAIAGALASLLRARGGEIRNQYASDFAQRPAAGARLSLRYEPRTLAAVCGDVLPQAM